MKRLAISKQPRMKAHIGPFQSTDREQREFSYELGYKTLRYNDNDFHLDLARLSLAKSLASYAAKGDYSTKDRNITLFHQELGFREIESNSFYVSKPEQNSIGVQFALKRYFTFTMVSIAIRSGGYQAEWGGNFRFGKQGHHEGFEIAAKEVLKLLNEYIQKHRLFKAKRIRFWIAGYSRGGAVANLVSAELLHQLHEGSEEVIKEATKIQLHPKAKTRVYAYTFETPLAAFFNTQNDCQKCIYNIYSPKDLVPSIPFAYMGFKRYGTDILIDVDDTKLPLLKQLMPNRDPKPFQLMEFSGVKMVASKKHMDKAKFIQEMLRFFEFDFQLDRARYVDIYQEGLANVAAFFKSTDPRVIGGILSNLKVPTLLASLINKRHFSAYIRSLIKPFDLPLDKERVKQTIDSLYPLITELIKIDTSHRFLHLMTMFVSSGSIFAEHDIELIYAYMMQATIGELHFNENQTQS